MHIYYENGPPSIGMGVAGIFKRGVSRDIDDALAKQILGKKSVQFKEGERAEEQLAPDPAGDKKRAGKGVNLEN